MNHPGSVVARLLDFVIWSGRRFTNSFPSCRSFLNFKIFNIFEESLTYVISIGKPRSRFLKLFNYFGDKLILRNAMPKLFQNILHNVDLFSS